MDAAKGIGIGRMIIGFASIFLAIYFLPDAETSLRVIAALMVGAVGALSFISHTVFYKADAKRLGWEAKDASWQFEVGFANLAFGASALIAVAGGWGSESLALITIGYAVYLLQAAMLHGYQFFHERGKPIGHLVRSSLLTLVYVAAMLAFVLIVLADDGLLPL